MRIVIILLFFSLATNVSAQTSFVKEAVAKLDKALVAKDTITLKQLLHKDVTYGHSNAWIENKREVINDLLNGKLTYSKIKSKDLLWKETGGIVTVRGNSEIEYVLDGKPGTLNLHVLQVWVKQTGRWQLLARQSTKVEKR